MQPAKLVIYQRVLFRMNPLPAQVQNYNHVSGVFGGSKSVELGAVETRFGGGYTRPFTWEAQKTDTSQPFHDKITPERQIIQLQTISVIRYSTVVIGSIENYSLKSNDDLIMLMMAVVVKVIEALAIAKQKSTNTQGHRTLLNYNSVSNIAGRKKVEIF